MQERNVHARTERNENDNVKFPQTFNSIFAFFREIEQKILG